MAKRSRQKPKPGSLTLKNSELNSKTYIVLALSPRTESSIRGAINYSICTVIAKTGQTCDVGNSPAHYFKTLGAWLIRAQDIAEHLRLTHPKASVRKSETRPLFDKELTEFGELLFKKITSA